ncbi:9545_t:CDS:2 [Diversispora eburnea]|uniref:9545_t:CDS:1 n=1 Tax=Diversispora eburnea TaxID=1213867 RepID=A0A9N8UX74_9GLOM|nr:9545_t:CDS:2 [Diversispora eburnea]
MSSRRKLCVSKNPPRQPNAPKEVKDRYEEIQSKAQSIHNELFPGHKFRPRKRQTFKMHSFPHENFAKVTTFSSTNYLNRQLDNYSEPPALSNSSDSPKINYSLKFLLLHFLISLNILHHFQINLIEEFNESLENFDPFLDLFFTMFVRL